MEKFIEIYNSFHWGNDNNEKYKGSSGPGSEIWYNTEYIEFLQKFIINNNIESVVDLGCGNCKCLNVIYDILNITYTGYDIYKEIIDYNIDAQTESKYKFIHSDFFKNKNDIISSDLCVIKDVLMHWKLETIYQFMDYLITSRKFKFILLINCCNQIEDDTDINEYGMWRPLSGLYLDRKSVV